MADNPPPQPSGLQNHMAKFSGDNYVQGWADLWNNKQENEKLPWDRGCHSIALEDLLTKLKESGEGVFANHRRRRALVPGCGTGYDVLLLSSFGFDTYGLDYSHAAVEYAKGYAATNTEKYPIRDAEIGRGKVVYVEGDYFKDDWLEKIGLSDNSFDLIYDYTFFCALQPWLRPRWAMRHRQLLAPAPIGSLICLEWPRLKDPKTHGPPFAAPSSAYFAHLSRPGEEIAYDSDGHVVADPSQKPSPVGLVRAMYYQPERTYPVGKDEKTGEVIDRVSVWRRQDASGV
ncbi:thiol methyltransferase, putative [Talaromyces stipitatus ATCC 10500]|uniref:Thiol methyltransferase, putative n=1 Tax=Talaromyces stipitatus (strain ATCC 10500 / CBS 375.48 / QM 6759 / NRRL 1006) TaxID=441959 RepID=B8M9D6_TALSN|nr:thiol methyltransferase, putative [Talaromyces stipitatus ATCC 10500]EED17696.1 thiol methyltransferase, putative [Talaromyces stipitatus ATCC 10500]